VIRKAVLLFVELKRDLEYCEHEVRYLVSKLPAGWQKVMHGKRQIGFLLPPHDVLPAMRARLHKALEPFENYWFAGVSGEVSAKNGSMDPLASRIKEYSVPVVRRRERT
jgi:hypothetical protein